MTVLKKLTPACFYLFICSLAMLFCTDSVLKCFPKQSQRDVAGSFILNGFRWSWSVQNAETILINWSVGLREG